MLLGALSLLAVAVWLYAARASTFYGDEWHFVRIEGLGGVSDWMAPYYAHWSLVPMILWKTVFAVVGLTAYWPYLVLLLIGHLVAAAALFILLRRRHGPFVALCAATVLLFLGAGYQNLVYSFQLGLVASTAAGLWAMVAFDSQDRRAWAAGALLVMVSLASSAMGPVFLIATGVELMADSRRRRAVLWLLPPALVFTLWYLTQGHAGAVEEAQQGTTDPATILWFVVATPARLLETLFQAGPLFAVGLYLSLVAAVLHRRGIPPRTLGAGAGIVALIVMVTVARGSLGLDYVSTTSRYVYESTVLLILGSTALLPRVEAPHMVAVGGLTAFLLAANLPIIAVGAERHAELTAEVRGVAALIERYGADRLGAPSPVDRPPMPSPNELATLMDRYGRIASETTPALRDRALRRLVGGALTPVPSGPPSGAALVLSVRGVRVTVPGPCVDVEGGTALTVEGGVRIRGAGSWRLGLGRELVPDPADTFIASIGDGWYEVRPPDLGDDSTFLVLLGTPSRNSTVCAA